MLKKHKYYDKVGASAITKQKIMTCHNIDSDHFSVVRCVNWLHKSLVFESLLVGEHGVFENNTIIDLRLFT